MGKYLSFWPEWTVEEKIGKGSYGTVYKIRKSTGGSSDTDIYSALKVLYIMADDSEIHSYKAQGMNKVSIRKLLENDVKAIENEIRVMISLASAAGIVTIEDYHISEMRDRIGWEVYIRMELLESLPAYTERVGTFTREEALKMGLDLCDALTACENVHIIHRDIKPANIFRNRFGQYKLGDFGVAKQMEGTNSAATRVGTPSFEAPEIFINQKYDHTVDIYGLGMVLYTVLNQGRKPFYPPYPEELTRENMQAALERRLKGDKLPPVAGMDPELYAIIEKACAFQASGRYQSAAEMKDDLETYRFHLKKPAVSAGRSSQKSQFSHALSGDGETTLICEKKKSPKVWLIAAGITAGIIILSALYTFGIKPLIHHSETPAPTTIPAPEPTVTLTPEATATPTPEPTNTPKPIFSNTPIPADNEELTPGGIHVKAEHAVYIADSNLILREDASYDAETVYVVPAGTTLVSTGTCDNGWLRIEYLRTSVYVSGKHLTMRPEITQGSASAENRTPGGIPVEAKHAVYTADSNLILREDASYDAETAFVVPEGTALISTGICENGWIRIEYHGKNVYVSGKNVTLK